MSWDGAALGAEGDASTVNPDVLCDCHIVHISPGFSVVTKLVVQAVMFLVCHVVCNYSKQVLNKDKEEIRKLLFVVFWMYK